MRHVVNGRRLPIWALCRNGAVREIMPPEHWNEEWAWDVDVVIGQLEAQEWIGTGAHASKLRCSEIVEVWGAWEPYDWETNDRVEWDYPDPVDLNSLMWNDRDWSFDDLPYCMYPRRSEL